MIRCRAFRSLLSLGLFATAKIRLEMLLPPYLTPYRIPVLDHTSTLFRLSPFAIYLLRIAPSLSLVPLLESRSICLTFAYSLPFRLVSVASQSATCASHLPFFLLFRPPSSRKGRNPSARTFKPGSTKPSPTSPPLCIPPSLPALPK